MYCFLNFEKAYNLYNFVKQHAEDKHLIYPLPARFIWLTGLQNFLRETKKEALN